MPTLQLYIPSMQNDVDMFFTVCFAALGWKYEPVGEHSDIIHIIDEYMMKGGFWCLYDGEILVGTVAIRKLDDCGAVCEMKRFYVLPEYQGKGYGGLLFKTALNFAKSSGYKIIRLDTRQDRMASRHLIDKHRFRRIEQYNQNVLAELFYELDLTDYDLQE